MSMSVISKSIQRQQADRRVILWNHKKAVSYIHQSLIKHVLMLIVQQASISATDHLCVIMRQFNGGQAKKVGSFFSNTPWQQRNNKMNVPLDSLISLMHF